MDLGHLAMKDSTLIGIPRSDKFRHLLELPFSPFGSCFFEAVLDSCVEVEGVTNHLVEVPVKFLDMGNFGFSKLRNAHKLEWASLSHINLLVQTLIS